MRLAWKAKERATRRARTITPLIRAHLAGQRQAARDELALAMRQAHARGASYSELGAMTGQTRGSAYISEQRAWQIAHEPMPCGCVLLHDCEDFPVPEWARRYLAAFDARLA